MALPIPTALAEVLAHPVAVFGAGVSGRAVVSLVSSLGGTAVVFDEQGGGEREDFRAADARSHRLVVFSPGFAPSHRWIVAARAAGCVCLGEIDFASLFWRGSLIGITGTNGKTTLTEFLAFALGEVGRNAYATGNIGHSFSQLVVEQGGGVFDDIAICEISSFQAETLVHFRADATLWTNFAEDHLERHPGMRAYFDAKWRLVQRTAGGVVLAGTSVQAYAIEAGCPLPPEACVATAEQPADVFLIGTPFEHYPQRENFLMAQAWWRSAGLCETALYESARRFRVGRHRLSRVRELGGVTFWNDSKATNFHAVEGALANFPAPVVLIAGGKSKGGDLAAFVARIAPRVKHACLIGETRSVLATFFAIRGIAHTVCGSLDEAVGCAAERAAPGDNVLLSPGFASFDQFRGYADRGDQFEQKVNALGVTV